MEIDTIKNLLQSLGGLYTGFFIIFSLHSFK